MKVVTVTQASPLMVRETASSTPIPARLMTRGDTYAPAVNDRVIAETVAGRLYVLGAA